MINMNCPVCEGFGTVPRSLVPSSRICTCGAGPVNELTLHDVHCDTVPCPFCQLMPENADARG